MSKEPASPTWDDGTDLRRYVEVVLRRGWVIVALVVVALLVAAVFNSRAVETHFESPVAVSLPAFDARTGLGLPREAYREFAVGAPVLEKMRTQTSPGPGLSSEQLRGRFRVQLENSTQFLTVTALAETAEEASQLAQRWLDAFQSETTAYFQGQLFRRKETTGAALDVLRGRLGQDEDALAQFDSKNAITLMEAQLSALEKELVQAESRLRELEGSVIPAEQAKLAYLEGAIAKEERLLAAPGALLVLPKGDQGGEPSTSVTVLNPVYFQLSQELVITRSKLTADQQEARSLANHVGSLRAAAGPLRVQLVPLQRDRVRLARASSEANGLYEETTKERDELLRLERQVLELSRLQIVSEPKQPQAPVTPPLAQNLLLAGVSAALLGIIVVLFQEWWSRSPSNARARPRETEAMAETAETKG